VSLSTGNLDFSKKIRINGFNKNTKIIADVIDKYQNLLMNKAPTSSINIEDLIQDQSVHEASNYHLFDNPEALNTFNRTKFDTSVFVMKLGQQPVWKPRKFKPTKKSEVANTIDEIYC
jgi:hypothetical protein